MSLTAASAANASITVGGQRLGLLPQKAVLLEESRTLLVADAHLGKAVSFRRLGVPVPQGTTSETLGLLTQLVVNWDVRHIIFLGDFLHSVRSFAPDTMAALTRWRERHAGLALTLVRGNHDDRAGDPPAHLGITVVDEPLRLAGLALCHHPQVVPGAYVLAGHLHPCIRLVGRAADTLRLPCFRFDRHTGVLPAFGAFTGMAPIRVDPGNRVFAVTPERVVEIPLRADR